MKWIKWILGILLFLIAMVFLVGYLLNEKEPIGMSTRAADEMGQKMLNALDKPAWDSTRYLTWKFLGKNYYVWDKLNDQVYVKIKDTETILNTNEITGISRNNEGLLENSANDQAVTNAWNSFCNDGFWLYAPYKIFDPGTSRSIVELKDGRKGLKVKYSSGGVTPGDAYVWILNEHSMPISYKIWVKIMPIGGLEFSWEEWIEISTGAKLASKHVIKNRTLEITDIKGGMTLQDIGLSPNIFDW